VAHSPEANSTRPDPRSITIADSMMLVIGVAVALALPWYSGWSQTPQAALDPPWRVILSFIEELIGKSSLALVPLMLYRRARARGLCRPGELLLVVCAARVIADQVGRLSMLEMSPSGIDADEFYWSSLKLAEASCALALATLIIFRKRLPDIAVSYLLVVAVAGSYPWLVHPLWRGHNLLLFKQSIHACSASDYSVFIAAYALESVVPALIGVAAIADAVRSRFRIGAMASTGSVLAALNLVVALAIDLQSSFTTAPPSWNHDLLYVLLAAPASAALLGWALYYLIRPRWRRWLARNSAPEL
jgi:hypothetical protein